VTTQTVILTVPVPAGGSIVVPAALNDGDTLTATVHVPAPPPVPTLAYSSSIPVGATIKGKLTWTALVVTGVATRIEFWIDRVLRWTESNAPYQFNGDPAGVLDTALLPDGSHQLEVIGYDAAGAHSPGGGAVTVANAGIPPPPVIVPPPGALPPVPAGLASGVLTLQQAATQAGPNAVFGVPARVFLETVTPLAGQKLVAYPGAVIDGAASRAYAFVLSALGVTINGFEWRNHKTPMQDGAVRCLAAGSTVLHGHGHHNAGPAITTRADSLIEDTELDHNVQQGNHGSGPQHTVLRRCHVHDNNVAVQAKPAVWANGPLQIKIGPKTGWWWPADPFWEAGSGKVTRALSVLVEDSEFDHNGGVGPWADIASNNWTIRRCRIHDNDLSAPMFEISTGAVIEDNVIWHNGECDHRGWGWPANILISSATGIIEVRRNLVAHGLAGISVISQNRADKPAGSGSNIHVTDNTVCVAQKAIGWYDDWGGGFPGKIETGNVVYGGPSAARDAILTAAGVPLT
jgi:hypothetical protein